MTTTERPAHLPADMPWHITPYDPDEEFDPYVYDGSMSIEDYDLMHRNIAKERSETVKRCKTHPYIRPGHKSGRCILCRTRSVRLHALEFLLGVCAFCPFALGLMGAGIIWSLKGPVLCLEWWMLTVIGFACMLGALAWLLLAAMLGVEYLRKLKRRAKKEAR